MKPPYVFHRTLGGRIGFFLGFKSLAVRLLLLASGADPTICTSEGRSAIDIARECNQEIPDGNSVNRGFLDMQVREAGDGVTGGGISTKEENDFKKRGCVRVNSYVGFWGIDLE